MRGIVSKQQEDNPATITTFNAAMHSGSFQILKSAVFYEMDFSDNC